MESNESLCFLGGIRNQFIKWDTLLEANSMSTENEYLRIQCKDENVHNRVVSGAYIVMYGSDLEAKENLQRIQIELMLYMKRDETKFNELELRIERLERKLDSIWFSPNMPGYFEAEESWKSKNFT